jgi:DegV family protein with EDD domain
MQPVAGLGWTLNYEMFFYLVFGLFLAFQRMAAAAAAAGADAAGVIARAEETRNDLKMWFAIDTLEYLRRGGRIGGARAWIGGALKIKPILTLEEEITPVERVRTRARSLERLRGYMRQRHESGADGWVVQYIQDKETADALIEDCYEIYGCEPAFISEVGPVLGAHVGPGLLGVGGVRTELIS